MPKGFRMTQCWK